MNLKKIIRLSEWWEYKLTPLFALAYATALQAGTSLVGLLPWMLLVVLSIIVGAAYVSVANDYTDLAEDLACGKPNRLSKASPAQRRLLLAATILPGALFLIFLYRNALSATFYTLAWVAFSLYSWPPFRLKARGAWGVAADASGAHLFPTLTIVAAVYFFSNTAPSVLWMTAAGIWAFAYGLRGILWHQFLDRENDLRAGINTVATQRSPQHFRPVAIAIFCVEVAALGGLLFLLRQPMLWLVLGMYLAGVAVVKHFFGLRVVLLLPAPGNHYILGSTFYQFLLPVTLLIIAAWHQPAVWWLLVLHLVLFPQKLLAGLYNIQRLFRRLRAGKASA